MKEKQLYTAPAADLLVVRFEENVMSAQAKSMPTFIEDSEEDW